MLFIWRLTRYFVGNEVEPERVNDEVRWSLRVLVDRFVQISSGTYLLRVDRGSSITLGGGPRRYIWDKSSLVRPLIW